MRMRRSRPARITVGAPGIIPFAESCGADVREPSGAAEPRRHGGRAARHRATPDSGRGRGHVLGAMSEEPWASAR